MKIVVTHKSPDLDAMTSVWLIKRFLPNWHEAKVVFVSAGEKMRGNYVKEDEEIEIVDGDEVVHVDTGFGKFDHHQIESAEVSAASLVYDYVKGFEMLYRNDVKKEALRRMVDVVVDDDHYQEVYYKDPLAYHQEFSLVGIIEGLKLQFPGQDEKNLDFVLECLDSIFHDFESRVWAENEIEERGVEFETIWGKGIGIETVNDQTLDLGQKKGYSIAVRKDPNNGFVRIKSLPQRRSKYDGEKELKIDLTPVYEKLKKMDPDATWFLHVSKRMLLNGSSKNPKMKGTKLTLAEIIKVLQDLTR